MDQKELERDGPVEAETPEDVAVLYSWANLQGAKYRDFSASRREYRAQMRHRAAEAQREAERRAQIEAEAAATAAEKAAREAEEAARFHESAAKEAASSRRANDSQVEEAARARAMRAASDLARQASMDRIEAARRAEAVAAAEAAAKREAREMAEAHASSLRQAQRYQESEVRRRHAAGPQPVAVVGGQISDPYTIEPQMTRPDRIFHQPLMDDDMQPSRFRQRDARVVVPQPDFQPDSRGAMARIQSDSWTVDPTRTGETPAAKNAPAPLRFYEPGPEEKRAAVDDYVGRYDAPHTASTPRKPVQQPQIVTQEPFAQQPSAPQSAAHPRFAPQNPSRRPQGYRPDEVSGFHPAYVEPTAESSVPAWIYGKPEPEPLPRYATPPPPSSPVADTLQHSRERVAARWYALKGVFDQGTPHEPVPEPLASRVKEVRAPLLTVFSLAGGVGKTSLVATLGRALSSTGEKVLLTDTTSHGLLPFYFGASELRPGVVRTFSPPAGSSDAPIYLVSYDVNQKTGDAAAQDWLADELARNGRGMQRVLLDLTPGAAWVARRLTRMNSTVLVPVAPDMNSVISLQAVEKFFAGMTDADGRPVQPFYLLNQFDASLPLHLDVREVMRQQLGDRLLPFVIRRSPSVSEALAEGMTVMDYAPDAPVASDYMNLASWLRGQAAPASAGLKNARWSEQ